MDAYLPPFWPTVVLVSLLISVAGVAWLVRKRHTFPVWVTDRFYFGLPWGSIIVLGVVLAIYLVVQDGITAFDQPVFLPFVNWSYLYPTGVLLSAFTHASAGHLLSNLVAAAVLAPLAEYIWGHYPNRLRWKRRHHPAVRAFLIFPVTVLVFGLVTSLFTWGPVIGFSGVVFAFAGFTVIRFPMVTVVALLGRSALRHVGDSLFNPIVEATTTTTMSTPAWVGISFQGHGIGFLVGAFLGVLLLHYRDQDIDPLRLWIGLLLVMIGMGLWAIWGSRGEDVYVLYRGLGTALIFLAAILITAVAVSSDRPITNWWTRRRVAVLVLAIPILILAGIAMPLNALAISDYETPERAVTVDGYDVFYATDAQSALRPVLYDSEPGSEISGVIVVNEERYLWTQGISSERLAHSGAGSITIGGPMERVDLTANRTAWEPAGNDSVYLVDLEGDGIDTPVYASNASTAEHLLGGYQIALDADVDDGFSLRITDPGGTTEAVGMPAANESVTVGAISVERETDALFGVYDDTRVQIAERGDD